jgi:hypothetical protein
MNEHCRNSDDGRRDDVRELTELPMPRAALRADQLRLHDEHAEPQRERDAMRMKPEVRLLEQPREVARPERPHRQRQEDDEEARAEAEQSGCHASIHGTISLAETARTLKDGCRGGPGVAEAVREVTDASSRARSARRT